MKLLLDNCMSRRAARQLRNAGHDVEHVMDWPADPGDAAILARALAAGQILVTLDRDFGELAVRDGHPHSGIVRLVNVSAHVQGSSVAAALMRHGPALANGAIVTVRKDRTRLRPP